MQDLDERDRAPEEPEDRVKKKDPSGIRTGWRRPLVIVGILAVILLAIRLLLLLFTL